MTGSKIYLNCLVTFALSFCMATQSSATTRPSAPDGYPDCRSDRLADANLTELKNAIQKAISGPPIASRPANQFFKENLTIAASTQLGVGRPVLVVYVSGRSICGSSGCNAYVLERRTKTGDQRYKLLAKISPARLPISVLPATRNGWRDIGVTVAGGGIIDGYIGALSFDGKLYASNPTLSNIPHVKKGSGELLLGPPGASRKQCRLR